MGRSFIIALHGATRAIRLYPVENEAVKKALDDLTAVTTEILTREGEFELRVTSEFIFINQTRLRLDLDNYASFTQILSLFRAAGVGVARVHARRHAARLARLPLAAAGAVVGRGGGSLRRRDGAARRPAA